MAAIEVVMRSRDSFVVRFLAPARHVSNWLLAPRSFRKAEWSEVKR